MENIKFKSLFRYEKKSKLKASDSVEDGEYLFYTSSLVINKTTNDPTYFNEAIILGNGGSANVHYSNTPFSTTSHCYVAIPKSADINVKYVYYYFYSNLYILERGFKGAGLKNISSKYIDDIEIPIPDRDTQNKIVSVLDKAESILTKKKQALSKYNELLRAFFLDMFGDSFQNPKEWKKSTLESICNKIVDCPHETPEYINESVFYCIRSSDIQENYIDLSETRTVTEETYKKRITRHEPQAGEVLYTREGGRLGNAARVPENTNICLGQRMMLFDAKKEKCNNNFLWALLNSNSIKNLVKNMSGGGAAPRINISQLKKLEVILPPIELQRKFSDRVIKIDIIKSKLKRSLKESSNLLNSLSQKAFSGELDFNAAVDLEVLLENDYDFFKDNSSKQSIQLLIQRLDKNILNEKKFNEQKQYDKAKRFVFELLKEGKVKQIYDEVTKSVKLTVS